MGIILPVNNCCRIESDSTQWIVTQRSGNAWVARTFWQDLEGAVRDCVFLGLARPAEAAAIQQVIDRIDRQSARIATVAAGHDSADLIADLGDNWTVSANGDDGKQSLRKHWLLTYRDAEGPDTNRRETMGVYRTLDYALRQCLLMRLRQSGSLETLELIADDIVDAMTGPAMAV